MVSQKRTNQSIYIISVAEQKESLCSQAKIFGKNVFNSDFPNPNRPQKFRKFERIDSRPPETLKIFVHYI